MPRTTAASHCARDESAVDVLRRRVDRRHRMRETPRAHADLSVEGVAAHSGSVLVLRGDVNRAEVPHLAFVMDSVVALDPASLVIDLSETHSIALDALAIIAKAVAGLPKAEIRLPEASAEALLRLVAA